MVKLGMDVHGGLDDMSSTQSVDLWVSKYHDGRPLKRNSHIQGTHRREDYLRSGRPRTLMWVVEMFRHEPPTQYVTSSVNRCASLEKIESSSA
jgi:hypothetical protein